LEIPICESLDYRNNKLCAVRLSVGTIYLERKQIHTVFKNYTVTTFVNATLYHTAIKNFQYIIAGKRRLRL
jgi:uncharacterized membrane protein YhhN